MATLARPIWPSGQQLVELLVEPVGQPARCVVLTDAEQLWPALVEHLVDGAAVTLSGATTWQPSSDIGEAF